MDDFDNFDDLGRWEQVRVQDEEYRVRNLVRTLKAEGSWDDEDYFRLEVQAAERGRKHAPKRRKR